MVRVLHAIGQGAFGQQNLSGPGLNVQRDAQEGGKIFFTQQLLQQLRTAAGTAENQRGKFLLLIVSQVAGSGVHTAAVTGQLLGCHGQQMLGTVLLGIGAAAEGIHIHNRSACQAGTEILPLAGKIAKLAGQNAALKQTIQLHTHFFKSGMSPAAQAVLIAQNDHSIGRNEIHCGGELGINESHIPVRSWV